MNELSWVAKAREFIGTKEIVGKYHNPKILEMWDVAFHTVGQTRWVKDDETPWCGAFMGYIMTAVGLTKHVPKTFYRARSWEGVGTKLYSPAYGCVVTFSRTGGGHVGIVVGQDSVGHLMVLGGNQRDQVCIRPFSRNRVTSYRWCGTMPNPLPERYNLPILRSDGKLSTNEA